MQKLTIYETAVCGSKRKNGLRLVLWLQERNERRQRNPPSLPGEGLAFSSAKVHHIRRLAIRAGARAPAGGLRKTNKENDHGKTGLGWNPKRG